MKRAEHLLVCIAEECAEVQKEIAKALRFGLDNTCPEGMTNRERLGREIIDLMAAIRMFNDQYSSLIPMGAKYNARFSEKYENLQHYINLSADAGLVEEDRPVSIEFKPMIIGIDSKVHIERDAEEMLS
jgi:hypothetical protein